MLTVGLVELPWDVREDEFPGYIAVVKNVKFHFKRFIGLYTGRVAFSDLDDPIMSLDRYTVDRFGINYGLYVTAKHLFDWVALEIEGTKGHPRPSSRFPDA